MQAVFKLDKRYVRRSFAAASETYDGMADLQRKVGLTLLNQYPIEITQGNILDLGCGTGFITQQLLSRMPVQVQVFALDIALPMCREAKNKNAGMDNMS